MARKKVKKTTNTKKTSSTKGDFTTDIHCLYDELVDPNLLKEHPAQPYKHPDAQIDKLAHIMQSQGIRWPIVVSKRSGFIVAGHCRKYSAAKLGYDKYPVVYQDYKDEAEELAVLVADNQIQELSEIDGLKMADIIVELDRVDYPLELTAFTPEQIDNYVTGPTNIPDNIKEAVLPDSQFGVVIECDDEKMQKEIYLENTKKGRTCRLLTL